MARSHPSRAVEASALTIGALLLLLPTAESFSWPRPKPSPTPGLSSRGRGSALPRLPLVSRINGTEWAAGSVRPPRATSCAQELAAEVDVDHSRIERELIESYAAYQSLLDSLGDLPEVREGANDASISAATVDAQDVSSTSTPTPTSHQPPATFPILTDAWKARLLLLLSAALYGTNFTMVKSLDERMSVGLSSTLRFGLAALAMLPWLLAPIDEELKALAREGRRIEEEAGGRKAGGNALTKRREEPTRLSAGLCGLEIGLYNGVGYIAQAVGLKTTTASKSAFICSMAVVTVPILDHLWGKQLLRRQILGAALAALGVYALELGGGQESALTEGDMMSLIQPLMFGFGFWRMEAAMAKYPTEAGRLAAAQLLMVFLISVSYLVCWSPAGDDLLLADACNVLPTPSEIVAWLQDPYILGMLFWTGVVTTAFTIWMETLALKTLSAAETTLIFSTEPLFGAAFAAVVANECLGTEAAMGAAFIIGGCLVSGMDIGRFMSGDRIPTAEETSASK